MQRVTAGPRCIISMALPIALNAGDYLIGAGYRLLSELDCPIEAKAALLGVAAQCHQTLCQGQGEELWSIAQKQVPSVEKMLDIFSQKTSPAFEAALKIGALLAGGQDTLLGTLHRFSLSMGSLIKSATIYAMPAPVG